MIVLVWGTLSTQRPRADVSCRGWQLEICSSQQSFTKLSARTPKSACNFQTAFQLHLCCLCGLVAPQPDLRLGVLD